jgi:light-regulated signal transduction histidine kinase (bacteriophytochrome)
LHPEDGQQIPTKWHECIDHADTWDVEMRYRDTDGKYHPVLARGVPVRDENGKIVSWAGINLDISRLKEAQAELHQQAEELRRSNRDLEQFAFVASHDLQEPLRTVNIYTHLLLKRIKTDDSPELEQFAGFVRDGVQRMESLIRDLLEYSRVLQPETERLPVDAGRIAREAVDICQVSAEQSGAEIDIRALPCVFVGEAQLRQIFQNLISNGLKYHKADVPPRLRISGGGKGQQVLFKVEDNGIGFAPEYSEKIFKLFTRLNGRQFDGTGLGLAICQKIVEQHGGRIWADSKPNQGATFFFTLPSA